MNHSSKKSLLLAAALCLGALCPPAFANIATPTARPSFTPPPVDLLAQQPSLSVPLPVLLLSDAQTAPMVLVPLATTGSNQLDATALDALLTTLAPNARHYPPNFPNKTASYLARQNVNFYLDWLKPYADAKNASFGVLLRAAKLAIMGRNMDMGPDFSVAANTYLARALALQPNDSEINFLYGMMLTESGGFKEGKKYLDKAANMGYTEAEQSLAQADLIQDKRAAARSRLEKLAQKHADNAQLAAQLQAQLELIRAGEFNIWDIKNNQLKLKPAPKK